MASTPEARCAVLCGLAGIHLHAGAHSVGLLSNLIQRSNGNACLCLVLVEDTKVLLCPAEVQPGTTQGCPLPIFHALHELHSNQEFTSPLELMAFHAAMPEHQMRIQSSLKPITPQDIAGGPRRVRPRCRRPRPLGSSLRCGQGNRRPSPRAPANPTTSHRS